MTAAGLTGEARTRAVQRVLLLTLALNLGVAFAKIAYGIAAASLSIRADGFHSLTDSANNLAGLLAVRFAGRPADAEHPYGHDKFEIVFAGLVGLSLLAMAFDVAKGAADRLLGEGAAPPQLGSGAFLVLVGTLLVNLGVARYESRRGRELESGILLSDAEHTRSDAFVTFGIILAVIFVRAGYPWLDVVGALAVAAFIGWAGIAVLRRNLSYLADTALIDPERIEALVLTVPGVASTHKIRTRGTPNRTYVDLHIQIAPHLSVVQAHRVTHWVIDTLKGEFAGVHDVLVHTEPARPDQPYRQLPEDWTSDGPP